MWGRDGSWAIRAEGQIGRDIGRTDGREEISWRLSTSIRPVSDRLVHAIPDIILEHSFRPPKRPPPRYHSSPSTTSSTFFPATMTPLILSMAVSLALLFVCGAWAQSDMANCRPGWEWVRSGIRSFRADIYTYTKGTAVETLKRFCLWFVESELSGPGSVSYWCHLGCFVSPFR